MEEKTNDDTTLLLRQWTRGDTAAGELLFNRLYDDLRGVASKRLRAQERQALGLQTTALVNELYLRVVDQKRVDWQDRNQFFAVAARLMRRILVDHARTLGSEKRGGRAKVLSLEELGEVPFGERPAELLALDACLEDLERLDPSNARLVELRFFAGLSLEDSAEALGVSRATAIRKWRLVKGWLLRQLQASDH